MQQAQQLLRDLWHNPKAVFPDDSIIEALEVAYAGAEDLILCTRTGGGKSLVPILLSQIESDGTIVVLPLRSLMHDWKKKLTAYGLKFTYYDAATSKTVLDTTTTLILVSCDQFLSAAFDEAIARYERQRPVYRVVLDEGHVPFIACNFRRALRRMSHMRLGPHVQVIIVTGTAPPSFLPYIARFFGLTDCPVVIRSCSSRPELAYSIEKVDYVRDILPRLQEYLSECDDIQPYDPIAWDAMYDEPPPPELQAIFHLVRQLIYVPSKSLGYEISAALRCAFYNATATGEDNVRLSQAELDHILDDWQSPDSPHRTLVATNRYSEGNDNPYVISVVHANTPTGMIGYHQETNRAARHGIITGFCHMIASTQFTFLPEGALDFKGERAINDLVFRDVDVCIRFAVTFYVDGFGILCDPARDHQCNRCIYARSLHLPPDELLRRLTSITIRTLSGEQLFITPEEYYQSIQTTFTSWDGSPVLTLPEAYHSSLRRRKVEYASDVRRWNAIQRSVKPFASKCVMCTTFELPNTSKKLSRHSQFFHCPNLDKHSLGFKYVEWRKQLKYSYDGIHISICRKCHLCKGDKILHPEDFTKCPSTVQDIIAPALWCLYWRPLDMRPAAESFFKTSWPDLDRYREWLLSDPGDDWESNLLKLYVWFYESYIAAPRSSPQGQSCNITSTATRHS